MFNFKLMIAAFSYLFHVSNHPGKGFKAPDRTMAPTRYQLPAEVGNIKMSFVPLFQTRRTKI